MLGNGWLRPHKKYPWGDIFVFDIKRKNVAPAWFGKKRTPIRHAKRTHFCVYCETSTGTVFQLYSSIGRLMNKAVDLQEKYPSRTLITRTICRNLMDSHRWTNYNLSIPKFAPDSYSAQPSFNSIHPAINLRLKNCLGIFYPLPPTPPPPLSRLVKRLAYQNHYRRPFRVVLSILFVFFVLSFIPHYYLVSLNSHHETSNV